MREQHVEYTDQQTLLEAYVASPDPASHGPGPYPVVLVAHMWSGRCEFSCQQARRLAELGYVGFALDMFGKGVLGASKEQNTALIAPFKVDRQKMQQRMLAAQDAALALANVDSRRMAAIGYCFGGLCVLDLARVSEKVSGVVSFHGDLALPNNIQWPKNNAKVLILHGHDDPLVLQGLEGAIKTQMTAANVDWQFLSLGHTVHSFTNPAAADPDFGAVFSPSAARRSWRYMTSFLDEVLPRGERP